jgi:hypothetical protein
VRLELEDVLCLNIELSKDYLCTLQNLGRDLGIVQAFLLAAAEQYLLNPANVICIVLIPVLDFIYNPIKQSTGVIEHRTAQKPVQCQQSSLPPRSYKATTT